MNGYDVLSQTYRKAAEEGKITKEQADADCRIFDFLSTCSDEDICRLFDSSAFNEIAKSYLRLAVKELIGEGTITEDQGQEIRNRFSLLFDEKKAGEIIG